MSHTHSSIINWFPLILAFQLFLSNDIRKKYATILLESCKILSNRKSLKSLIYCSIELLIPYSFWKQALRSSKLLFQNIFHRFNGFIKIFYNSKITNNAFNWNSIFILDASSKYYCHSLSYLSNSKAIIVFLNIR